MEATEYIRGPLEQLVSRLVDAGVTGEVRIDLGAGESLTDFEGCSGPDEVAIVDAAISRMGPTTNSAR